MTTRIENWTFQASSAYTPPECRVAQIKGRCYDHPDLPDGSRISTRPIAVSLTEFVSVSGRLWTLGTPAEGATPAAFLAAFGEVNVARVLADNPLERLGRAHPKAIW
jgi:hypothetical protein